MTGRLDVQPGELVQPPPGTEYIQFTRPLEDWQHRRIAAWLAEHPAATLRVYGNYRGAIADLEFLRHYPGLKGFEIDSMYGDTKPVGPSIPPIHA